MLHELRKQKDGHIANGFRSPKPIHEMFRKMLGNLRDSGIWLRGDTGATRPPAQEGAAQFVNIAKG
jgi:hypothetical protein